MCKMYRVFLRAISAFLFFNCRQQQSMRTSVREWGEWIAVGLFFSRLHGHSESQTAIRAKAEFLCLVVITLILWFEVLMPPRILVYFLQSCNRTSTGTHKWWINESTTPISSLWIKQCRLWVKSPYVIKHQHTIELGVFFVCFSFPQWSRTRLLKKSFWFNTLTLAHRVSHVDKELNGDQDQSIGLSNTD